MDSIRNFLQSIIIIPSGDTSSHSIPTSDVTADLSTLENSMMDLQDMNELVDEAEERLKDDQRKVAMLKKGCADVIRKLEGVWRDGETRSNDDVIRLYKQADTCTCDECVAGRGGGLGNSAKCSARLRSWMNWRRMFSLRNSMSLTVGERCSGGWSKAK